MKRSEFHPGRGPAQQILYAGPHLFRRFVRERDGEDPLRVHLVASDQVGDAARDDARLARARARQDEQGALGVPDGFLLGRVQPLQQRVGDAAGGRSPQRDLGESGVDPGGSRLRCDWRGWGGWPLRGPHGVGLLALDPGNQRREGFGCAASAGGVLGIRHAGAPWDGPWASAHGGSAALRGSPLGSATWRSSFCSSVSLRISSVTRVEYSPFRHTTPTITDRFQSPVFPGRSLSCNDLLLERLQVRPRQGRGVVITLRFKVAVGTSVGGHGNPAQGKWAVDYPDMGPSVLGRGLLKKDHGVSSFPRESSVPCPHGHGGTAARVRRRTPPAPSGHCGLPTMGRWITASGRHRSSRPSL